MYKSEDFTKHVQSDATQIYLVEIYTKESRNTASDSSCLSHRG